MAESEWVSSQLGILVIKAFNNIIAENMVTSSRSKNATERIALPIAGDDP